MTKEMREAARKAGEALSKMSIEEIEKSFLEKTQGMTDEEIVQEFRFFLGRLWEDDDE